jgi:hypothetical protein
MSESYLNYALSVIHARALPDVRDGLKPSQRRILVRLNDLKLRPEREVPQVRQHRGPHRRASTTRTASRSSTRRSCAWRSTSRCATR